MSPMSPSRKRQNIPRSVPLNSRFSGGVKLALAAALRVHKRYPNVVGISSGTKFVKGVATEDHAAIHFYVRRKVSKKTSKGRMLPSFIYGRFKNGKINRKVKFKTDVIEVGRVKKTCGSGMAITGNLGLTRQKGRITLLFKNKAAGDNDFYVVSCAHVLGDIDGRSKSIVPFLQSGGCCQIETSFGETLFTATQVDSEVEFDIAIGRVDSQCLPLPDSQISEDGSVLGSFMPTDQIIPDLPVECTLPVSKAKTGIVASGRGSIMVEYRRGFYEVQNAWLIKAERRVKEGDSGGLIYKGDVAIGILFASSDSNDGWAWFHPLGDALDFIRERLSFDLVCF